MHLLCSLKTPRCVDCSKAPSTISTAVGTAQSHQHHCTARSSSRRLVSAHRGATVDLARHPLHACLQPSRQPAVTDASNWHLTDSNRLHRWWHQSETRNTTDRAYCCQICDHVTETFYDQHTLLTVKLSTSRIEIERGSRFGRRAACRRSETLAARGAIWRYNYCQISDVVYDYTYAVFCFCFFLYFFLFL